MLFDIIADETDDPRKIFDFLYKNVQEVTPPPDLNLNDPNLHMSLQISHCSRKGSWMNLVPLFIWKCFISPGDNPRNFSVSVTPHDLQIDPLLYAAAHMINDGLVHVYAMFLAAVNRVALDCAVRPTIDKSSSCGPHFEFFLIAATDCFQSGSACHCSCVCTDSLQQRH